MNGDQRLQAGTNKMRRKLVCLELADWHVKMSPDKNQGRRAREMCRWLACACSHALSVCTYVCDSRVGRKVERPDHGRQPLSKSSCCLLVQEFGPLSSG